MSAQGPAESPLGEAPCETMEAPPNAAEPPVSQSRSTAAAPLPLVPGSERDVAMATADCFDETTMHSEAVVEPQRSSSRVAHKRARGDDLASITTAASPAAAASAAEIANAAAPEPPAAPVTVPASEFKERAELMFKLDAEGPVASGRLPATRVVSKEHVQFAWWAANEVCDDHGPALSVAYGNFDKLVACGWLLGDVALGRLIEKPDALKVGRKAGKLAPGLKAEFDAPARRLGKRRQPASEEDWAEAAREEEAMRRERVDLPFPDTSPLAPPLAPPPAPVALQRQRVQMPPPPPRVPPPRPPAARASRDPERLELLKALRAAEAVVSQAECAVAAAKRDRDKAKAAWDYAREQASNPHRVAQIPDDKWAAWSKNSSSEMEAARLRYCASERAIGDPEQALFWATHELKEARFDLNEYEKERGRQEAWQMQMANMDAEHEEKVRQIEAGIADNNALCSPGDPEYWDPDPQEAAILYRLWKLQ